MALSSHRWCHGHCPPAPELLSSCKTETPHLLNPDSSSLLLPGPGNCQSPLCRCEPNNLSSLSITSSRFTRVAAHVRRLWACFLRCETQIIIQLKNFCRNGISIYPLLKTRNLGIVQNPFLHPNVHPLGQPGWSHLNPCTSFQLPCSLCGPSHQNPSKAYQLASLIPSLTPMQSLFTQ